VLFGTTGTVLRNRPLSSDAYSVGALRLMIGASSLLAVAARSGRTSVLAPWRRSRLTGTLVGAAGVALFQVGYFLAVSRTGVAVGTVATIGSGPMLSGLITSRRSGEPPASRWLIGSAVCIAGVALLGLIGRPLHADAWGLALAGAAGLGWATFATIGRQQIENGVDSTASMAAIFSGGAVLLAPLLAWHHAAWVMTARGAAISLYLGVATVGLAYTLYGFGLRRLHAHTVITLTLLEPLTASLLAATVVHERIRPAGWLGVALVLAGLVVTAGDTTTVAA
jgi:DME family drug/metabolite transporter